MSKAVAKKEETAVAPPEETGSWGAEGIDSTDILIPRLLLMQPLSELVGEGDAQAGQIIKSTSQEVLYDGKKPFEFIPVMSFKTWRIMELKDGKYEFKRIEPLTAENVNEPYEWMDGNQQFRRDRTLSFYVLLPSEIKKEIAAFKKIEKGILPDVDDCLIPCLLSFMRTSSPAGKELATFAKKAQHFGLPIASYTFELFSEFEKNDKGNYHVFKVKRKRSSTPEEIAVCKKWNTTLTQATNIKIDDSLDDERVIEEGDEADIDSTF